MFYANHPPVQPNPQTTFFTNVKDSLPLPLFTADLKHAAPGSYDFGFINASRYTGTIEYFDVDSSSGYWAVNGTGYGVGADGKKIKETSIPGIVDTGTTLLLLPENIVKKYYNKVKGAKNDNDLGGYVFPCAAKLSDFYLSFGAYTAKITADLLNNGPGDPSDKSSKQLPTSRFTQIPRSLPPPPTLVCRANNYALPACFGGIQVAPSSNGAYPSIFGDIFLKSTFVVFKAPSNGQPSVGFAAKATNPLASLASS